ncbi:MAG: hypothetical protein CM1200mP30_28520 [Pseudomonadota bacterium]|nr:MAG: hypothetical protein CM1200mP30_28520 [Pseudomonadota bacterium]
MLSEKFEYFCKVSEKNHASSVFCSKIIISPNELTAESQGREIQNFVRSGTTLQARKKKAYENSQKESGFTIKSYLKNKSALQSKKISPLLPHKK